MWAQAGTYLHVTFLPTQAPFATAGIPRQTLWEPSEPPSSSLGGWKGDVSPTTTASTHPVISSLESSRLSKEIPSLPFCSPHPPPWEGEPDSSASSWWCLLCRGGIAALTTAKAVALWRSRSCIPTSIPAQTSCVLEKAP